MKANEAPEKIYVHEASTHELTENLPYHIEYIRKDAFIEKACEWLAKNKNRYVYNVRGMCYEETFPTCSSKLIEDFKKYMEE